MALLPLFYSTPLKFGGLELPPSTIGLTMGFLGMTTGLVQALFFAPLVNWYGPKAVFCAGVASSILTFAFFPIISIAAQWWGVTRLLWIPLLIQLVFQELSFGRLKHDMQSQSRYTNVMPPAKHSL
ncbi:hypothetical protein BV22DRAFT_1033400 [Leucogyrophana mollusca]|uniref:Uncharacterized protein n=1 Tax=Leucogyrophana mollusca TaxID=85980 RepID=A0ACB8BL36_9AGAM|nr:hypothetical protein BV22DRAFT_1033400 [Leucogyrophana mollusca]